MEEKRKKLFYTEENAINLVSEKDGIFRRTYYVGKPIDRLIELEDILSDLYSDFKMTTKNIENYINKYKIKKED